MAAAAQYGDRTRFDRYVEIYKTRRDAAASPQETNRYLYSLPEFEALELVDATLGLLDDGTIPQDAIGRVRSVMLGLADATVAAVIS